MEFYQVCGRDIISLKTIGERLLKIVDWLKLDINTVGCRLSGLSVKCSGARLVGPGFESRECGIVDAHC